MSAAAQDSMELQDLFDSIVAAAAPAATGAPTTTAPLPAPVAAANEPCTADTMISRIGHMTRSLHDSLRELGYDKKLEEAASSIPDARDRLSYVASMTERAAQRVLNAVDIAKPLQDRIEAGAAQLEQEWQKVFSREMQPADFKALAERTMGYLKEVPTHTRAANAQLTEIMMAQDFQDLTGQVVKRINELVHGLEQELLKVLVENLPEERRPAQVDGLLNGPVINAAGRQDVVTTQTQVDDLLAQLGF